jgi:hypothetical protein
MKNMIDIVSASVTKGWMEVLYLFNLIFVDTCNSKNNQSLLLKIKYLHIVQILGV